jgi:hypothetical protein
MLHLLLIVFVFHERPEIASSVMSGSMDMGLNELHNPHYLVMACFIEVAMADGQKFQRIPELLRLQDLPKKHPTFGKSLILCFDLPQVQNLHPSNFPKLEGGPRFGGQLARRHKIESLKNRSHPSSKSAYQGRLRASHKSGGIPCKNPEANSIECQGAA